MNSIEWDYSKTKVTPTDVVEAIAARTPDDQWAAVSARLSDLSPEVFCEQHGTWEPYDEPCSGVGDRMRLIDSQPQSAALPMMRGLSAASRAYLR